MLQFADNLVVYIKNCVVSYLSTIGDITPAETLITFRQIKVSKFETQTVFFINPITLISYKQYNKSNIIHMFHQNHSFLTLLLDYTSSQRQIY